MKRAIILLGLAGSGKSSVINKLIDMGVVTPIVTATNRKKRKKECGISKEYQFVSEKPNDCLVGLQIDDIFYCIRKKELTKEGIGILGVISNSYAVRIKEEFQKQGIPVDIVYLEVPNCIRYQRINKDRHVTEIKRKELNEEIKNYDFIIDGTKPLEEVVFQIISLIE